VEELVQEGPTPEVHAPMEPIAPGLKGKSVSVQKAFTCAGVPHITFCRLPVRSAFSIAHPAIPFVVVPVVAPLNLTVYAFVRGSWHTVLVAVIIWKIPLEGSPAWKSPQERMYVLATVGELMT